MPALGAVLIDLPLACERPSAIGSAARFLPQDNFPYRDTSQVRM